MCGIRFLVVFLFTCVLSGVQFGVAEELTKQEIIDLCVKTALKFKEKRETIRNWQGVVDVEVLAYRNSVAERLPRRQINARIEFAVDVVKNRRLSISTMQEDYELDAKGNRLYNSCDVIGIYVDNDAYYRLNRINFNSPETTKLLQNQMPGSTHEMLIMNHAISAGQMTIVRSDTSRRHTASLLEDFHPFVWLQPRTIPMDERFSTFADFVIQIPDFNKRLHFETKGNEFVVSNVYTGQIPPELNTFTVNMAKDFSIVSLQSKNHETGVIVYGWNAEFEKVDGILLPKKIEEISSKGTSITKIEFVENKINSPIPEDKFTLQYLGVRQGDRVYDGRTQTESTVTDTSFPRALSEAELLRPSRSFQWIRYSLIIAGIVMIFCALFFKLRQWTRKTK